MFNRSSQSPGAGPAALIVSLALLAAACGSSGDSSGDPGATATSPPTTAPSTTTTTTPPPSSTTTTTVAPTPLEPTEVVDAYYAAWTDGGIAEAMALASDDFTSSLGDATTTANYMAYAAAIGQQIAVSDCSSTRNGLSDVVTCNVQQTDPMVEALELLVPRVKHTVTEGQLTEIKFTETYGEADFYLGNYAGTTDPDGYTDACASGGSDGVLVANQVEYTEACGAYLAGHADAAAADILAQVAAAESVDPIALVTAFYQAWGSGDIDAAIALLSPRVTSPAGTQPGNGLIRLRSFMEYVAAIPQSIEAGDCESTGSLVNCHVEFRDPVIDALEIKGSSAPHEIKLGLISHVSLGAQYAESDAAIAAYLRESGGNDFATACAVPDDGSAKGELGLAFTANCGAFVAQHIDDVAAAS